MISRETNHALVPMLFLLGSLTLTALSGRAQEANATGVPKNKVVATVKGLDDPSAITISPDSTTVYVVDQGDVTVVDATKRYAVKATIQFIQFPFDAAVSPDGKTLYVSDSNNPGKVLVIDTTQSTYPVTNTVSVGEYPAGLALSPSGKQLYVANNGDLYSGVAGSISVIDTATLASTAISSNGQPLEVTLTPDGAQADVLNSLGTGFVQFIGTASGVVSSKIGVAGRVIYPVGLTSHTDTNSSAATLYIASYYNWVTACDAATGAVIKKILAVPSTSSEIILGTPAITLNGTYLYVPYSQDDNTNSQGTQVAMIRVQTGKIIGTPITVGKGPDWAQVSPDGKTLYVANGFDGTMTVVDIRP